MTFDALKEKAGSLPLQPGVYVMKDKSGQVIYVGKAKKLKNRVTSYFRNVEKHLPKVYKMVEHVHDFEYIVTDSEFEALILECSLIKQHKPKYNILLKDDKGYSYIRISDEEYPRITTEKNTTEKGKYLGPYTSSYITKEAVNEANRVFMLPTCNKKFPRDFRKERPCLNYHIKQCMGVCRGRISVPEYMGIIAEAEEFIRSGGAASIERMEAEMNKAAEELEFEKAAFLRDKKIAIERVGEKQKVSN